MTYTIKIRETTTDELEEMLDGTPEENATVDLLATAIAIDEALLNAMREAFPDATVELEWPMPGQWELEHQELYENDGRAYDHMQEDIYGVLASTWEHNDYWRFLTDNPGTGSLPSPDGAA
jgi:hypothetical protein